MSKVETMESNPRGSSEVDDMLYSRMAQSHTYSSDSVHEIMRDSQTVSEMPAIVETIENKHPSAVEFLNAIGYSPLLLATKSPFVGFSALLAAWVGQWLAVLHRSLWFSWVTIILTTTMVQTHKTSFLHTKPLSQDPCQ